MTIPHLAETVNLDVTWLLGVLAIMATTVTTLAGIIYAIMQSQIASLKQSIKEQHEDSKQQSVVMDRLQTDIKRMSSGCGQTACHWRKP